LSSLADAFALGELAAVALLPLRGRAPFARASLEFRGDEAAPLLRSGADGARYSPRELPIPGLGREDELPDDGLDIEPPPPLELPPPPPDGRDTADPLLLPDGFGRAPDWPLSWA
jgi:hypothetical protein